LIPWRCRSLCVNFRLGRRIGFIRLDNERDRGADAMGFHAFFLRIFRPFGRRASFLRPRLYHAAAPETAMFGLLTQKRLAPLFWTQFLSRTR